MIIDNTSLIRSLLSFPEQVKSARTGNSMEVEQRECFYVVQLLQRQKDNPDQQYMNPNFRNNSNRAIQQFQIFSLDDWDLKIPTIIKLARLYQARVYINLNPKDSKDVFVGFMQNLTDRMRTGNYLKLHRMYNEVIGKTPTKRNSRKTWLVDIDTHDESVINTVQNTIESLPGGGDKTGTVATKDGFLTGISLGKVYAKIPTKNGLHLITSTFDADAFKKLFPDIDVHENNPTIAWMETDWTNSTYKI